MIRRLLVAILVSSVALWAADWLLGGLVVTGGVKGYLVAGTVLGLLNTLVRPILKLITFPLILVTFGLFTVVINIALLLAAAHLTGLIMISGIGTLLWTTCIVSLLHIVFRPSH